MAVQEDRSITPDAAPTPSHQGSAGGDLATSIGARDEELNDGEESADRTPVRGADKAQPQIPTRADNEGAAS